jgi:hypothetical protein
MTEEEALKINELYKQIDVLTAQNSVLKESAAPQQLSLIAERLDTIEQTLRGLNVKGATK